MLAATKASTDAHWSYGKMITHNVLCIAEDTLHSKNNYRASLFDIGSMLVQELLALVQCPVPGRLSRILQYPGTPVSTLLKFS